MGKIVLSGELYKEYLDEENCFGSEEEDMIFDANVSNCKKCKDKKLCEEIFNAKPGTKILDASQADAAEVFDNEPTETKFKYNRENLTESLIILGKKGGKDFDVTKLQRVTKLFDGDSQLFKVSDKTLRVNGVTDGTIYGLKSSDFEEKTESIVIELTNTKAIQTLIMNFYKYPNTEEEPEFKEELDLETSDGNGENGENGNDTVVDKIKPTVNVVNTAAITERNLVGAVGVKVYSDDTLQIHFTVAKDRFDIDKAMDKMRELLESFLEE